MPTVSLSDGLTTPIASVTPQAVRVEKNSDSGCSPTAVLPREHLIEASLRNFLKLCTKQSKQWKVTLLKMMWSCVEKVGLSYNPEELRMLILYEMTLRTSA